MSVVFAEAMSLDVFEVGAAGLFEQSFSSSRSSQHWKFIVRAVRARPLSRRGSKCQRHLPESWQERERSGQVHDNAANRNQHTGAQFQQPLSERPNLSPCTA